jgi:hypothetical protein
MTRLSAVSIPLVVAALAWSALVGLGQAECKPGFVMREAYAGDQVCVTPQTREQVMEDNKAAASRRPAPTKDSCVQGYVWRQAYPQDHVCVTMAVRSQTAQDNQLAATRVLLPGMATMSGTGGSGAGRVESQEMQGRMTQDGGAAGRVPAGFHVAARGEVPELKMSLKPMHGRPAPLGDGELNGQLAKQGVPGRIKLPGAYTPNIKYQVENYTNNTGAEFDSSTIGDAIMYGADGYVQIDFNVQAGTQYMLDCSVGEDGSYKVATTFIQGENGTGWLTSTVSSYNKHILIPFPPAPKMPTARGLISFKEIEFYGCELKTVGQ